MKRDTLIIGAGVAGLACARELNRAGLNPIVLERSRGVGGRCATRRLEGQAVDHGVMFLHGSDPEFLAAVEAVDDATVLWGWPARIQGSGTPCQPRAFNALETRVAFEEGVNAFPKFLARDLRIERGVEVVSLDLEGDVWRLTDASGLERRAHDVVLGLPAPQAHQFVLAVDSELDELRAARALLGMMGSHPALALLALYPSDTPEPPFDVCYPAETRAVHVIAHDSAKRRDPAHRALVLHGRPCWTTAHIAESPDAWMPELLAEAAEIVGDWARHPVNQQPHSWSLARADRGMELQSPMKIEWPSGQRLGLCGEVFSPGAGVEAAYSSGRRLARRLLGEE